MGNDERKIITYEVLLVCIFSICTLLHISDNKLIYSIITLLTAIITFFLFKRKRLYRNNKKIVLLMSLFGVLYIGLFYMMGLYSGFLRSSFKFGFKTIFEYIIPIIVIIVSTEIIRSKLLYNDSKESTVLLTILSTIIDVSIYLDAFKLVSLNNFLSIIGFLIFSYLSSNLLYNYLSKKYGPKPVIIYKLIISLYLYILPIIPEGYMYLRTFFRMLYPLLIYLYLDKYYNTEKISERKKEEKNQIITLASSITVALLIIAFISCDFIYGILVIGSESMNKSISLGDAVVFKNTKDNIKENDIIVFKKDDIKIVHRVIKITNINGENRYYTKGDANKVKDNWYVTDDEIVGKVLFKIKYIGKPSLWLRKIFDKEGYYE